MGFSRDRVTPEEAEAALKAQREEAERRAGGGVAEGGKSVPVAFHATEQPPKREDRKPITELREAPVKRADTLRREPGDALEEAIAHYTSMVLNAAQKNVGSDAWGKTTRYDRAMARREAAHLLRRAASELFFDQRSDVSDGELTAKLAALNADERERLDASFKAMADEISPARKVRSDSSDGESPVAAGAEGGAEREGEVLMVDVRVETQGGLQHQFKDTVFSPQGETDGGKHKIIICRRAGPADTLFDALVEKTRQAFSDKQPLPTARYKVRIVGEDDKFPYFKYGELVEEIAPSSIAPKPPSPKPEPGQGRADSDRAPASERLVMGTEYPLERFCSFNENVFGPEFIKQGYTFSCHTKKSSGESGDDDLVMLKSKPAPGQSIRIIDKIGDRFYKGEVIGEAAEEEPAPTPPPPAAPKPRPAIPAAPRAAAPTAEKPAPLPPPVERIKSAATPEAPKTPDERYLALIQSTIEELKGIYDADRVHKLIQDVRSKLNPDGAQPLSNVIGGIEVGVANLVRSLKHKHIERGSENLATALHQAGEAGLTVQNLVDDLADRARADIDRSADRTPVPPPVGSSSTAPAEAEAESEMTGIPGVAMNAKIRERLSGVEVHPMRWQLVHYTNSETREEKRGYVLGRLKGAEGTPQFRILLTPPHLGRAQDVPAQFFSAEVRKKLEGVKDLQPLNELLTKLRKEQGQVKSLDDLLDELRREKGAATIPDSWRTAARAQSAAVVKRYLDQFGLSESDVPPQDLAEFKRYCDGLAVGKLRKDLSGKAK